jgi:hypothetical protein
MVVMWQHTVLVVLRRCRNRIEDLDQSLLKLMQLCRIARGPIGDLFRNLFEQFRYTALGVLCGCR